MNAKAALAAMVLAVSIPAAPSRAGENIKAYPSAASLSNHPRWKLEEIWERTGQAPYEKIRKDGAFVQSQRTIFRDVVFGGEIWKLTGPGVSSHHYYSQVPPWNADGSIMGFDANHPGQMTKAYLMDADGTKLREFPFRKMKGITKAVRFGYKCPVWDLDRPEIMYGVEKLTRGQRDELLKLPKEKRNFMTKLYAANVLTGELKVVREVPKGYMDSQPIRHEGRQWLIVVALPTCQRDYAFVTLSTDGEKMHYIPRSLFPRGRRDSVILARIPGYPFSLGGYIMAPDGTKADITVRRLRQDPARAVGVIEKSVLKLGGYGPRGRITGGHSCYSQDGLSAIGVGSQLTRIDFAPDRGFYRRRIVLSTGGSGHVSWLNRDRRWIFPTFYARPSRRDPCAGMVIKLATDGSEVVHRVAFHNSNPKVYAAQMRGVVSRDGTKVAFVSNALGRKIDQTSLYVAVVKHPDPPVGLAAVLTGEGVKLTWKRPFNSVETRGAYIYRSSRSGVGYEQLTPRPLAGLSFVDRAAPRSGPVYYVATAVEHSGLESSRYSNEAAVRPAAPWRLFIEAEDGICRLPCRTERDTAAVGDQCAWFALRESALTLPVAVPAAGEYAVWVRHKGSKRARLSIAEVVSASLGKSAEWAWTRLGASKLPVGRVRWTLAAEPGVKIDRICLTTDAAFVPAGRGNGDQGAPGKVAALAASEAAAHWVKLTWRPPADRDVRYFTIYCSRKAGFKPAQETLVWSPPAGETTFWDYGLQAGTKYHYRVTAVDRAGNESQPSDEVSVSTAQREP